MVCELLGREFNVAALQSFTECAASIYGRDVTLSESEWEDAEKQIGTEVFRYGRQISSSGNHHDNVEVG